MLTTEQFLVRQRGVAASEVACVLGKNPWKGPIDVWRYKVRGERGTGNSVRADWGNRLEDPIRAWYSETMGVEVSVPDTLWHPTDPIALATPDGVVYPLGGAVPRNGLEIKTHTVHYRHLYGEPGSDEVPIWELLQCVWGMYVTDLPWWHLVAFLDNLPTVYRIERDAELEALCVDGVRTFWSRYVATGLRPPADGTDSYTEELIRQFPTHLDRERLIPATPELMTTIAESHNVRDQIHALQHRQAVLDQTVKAVIGDAAGVTWREGRRSEHITWRKAKDSTETDWKAVALEQGAGADLLRSGARAALDNALAYGAITPGAHKGLLEAMGLDDDQPETTADIIARHTTVVPGTRRYCVPRSWSRERPDKH